MSDDREDLWPLPCDGAALCARVKELANQRGLSLTKLADQARVSYSVFGSWKRGTRPSMSSVRLLGRALGISPDELLDGLLGNGGNIWAKTGGRCYYCGAGLGHADKFTLDHFVPRSRGGNHGDENIVPACKSCNSSKGSKTLENFRFLRMMQDFERRNGLVFSCAQVAYLGNIGVTLDLRPHVFWFEQQEIVDQGNVPVELPKPPQYVP